MELLENTHPGLTAYKVAKGTGLTPIHISKLLRGQCSVTPLTSLLLGKYWGMSPRFWLNLQNRHDVIEAQRNQQDRLARVTPYREQ